jgi:Putative transposase
MFRLLFEAAWQSLKTVLETEQQYEAAAAMVLHTWNQHLESHVHLHAVVPGGGPSLKNPEQWKSAAPPPHQRPDRWWLVDVCTFCRGASPKAAALVAGAVSTASGIWTSVAACWTSSPRVTTTGWEFNPVSPSVRLSGNIERLAAAH